MPKKNQKNPNHLYPAMELGPTKIGKNQKLCPLFKVIYT